jgi:outer membrane protein OmpA-like peptidoglycan-associated protein
MKRLLALALIAATPLFAGCATWPAQGAGGLAELFSSSADTGVRSDGPLGVEDGSTFELDLVRRHLDVLVLEGAELCFPATVVQAKQREARIAREIEGGLALDAVNDIVVQRQLLARLERQLDYARSHDVCVVAIDAGESRPGDIAARVNELLNVDNQFAVDSFELNPKYVAHLGEAASLLTAHPGYGLRIVGHADASVEADPSKRLSLARAEQVRRYLQIMGIAEARMQVAAVGNDDPLFAGNSAATRLTNRRVSVELVELGGAAFAKE